jgi:hypothetical protein
MATVTAVTHSSKQRKKRRWIFFRSSKNTSPFHQGQVTPQVAAVIAPGATPATVSSPPSAQSKPQHTSGIWLLAGIPPPHPLSDATVTTELHRHLKSELDGNVTRGVGSRTIEFMRAGLQVDRLYPAIVILFDDKREKKEAYTFCSGIDWLEAEREQHKFKVHCLLAERKATVKKAMGLDLNKWRTAAEASMSIPLEASTLCGLTVFIGDESDGPNKKCVFGGLIKIDGTLYGLLARHTFDEANEDTVTHPSSEDSDRASSLSSDDEQPLTLSFKGSEEVEKAFPQPDIYIAGSNGQTGNSPRQGLSQEPSTSSILLKIRIYIPPTPTDEKQESDLDWALVDLSEISRDIMSRILLPNRVWNRLVDRLDNNQAGWEGTVKVAGTGSLPICGRLHPLPVSLRLGKSSHDVHLVALEKPLRESNILNRVHISDFHSCWYLRGMGSIR